MDDERKTIVAAGYDALSDRYLAWAALIDDPARSKYLAGFSGRLAAGSSMLDLGCGPGIPSTRALAERFRVTGVDSSRGQIEAARRNVPGATFVRDDLSTMVLPDGSFDGVTAFYAISHVPREVHGELFRRIAGWLRPGGLFLATLGAQDSPDWVGDWLGVPMFFSSFDAAENRRLLAAAGFDLLEAEVIDTLEPEGPLPFLWVLARTGGADA